MTENIRVNPREFDLPSKQRGLRINRDRNSGVRLYFLYVNALPHLYPTQEPITPSPPRLNKFAYRQYCRLLSLYSAHLFDELLSKTLFNVRRNLISLAQLRELFSAVFNFGVAISANTKIIVLPNHNSRKQSELKASTCTRCQERKQACQLDLGWRFVHILEVMRQQRNNKSIDTLPKKYVDALRDDEKRLPTTVLSGNSPCVGNGQCYDGQICDLPRATESGFPSIFAKLWCDPGVRLLIP